MNGQPQSRKARARRGRAARSRTPRESHGSWDPAAGRRDPVEILIDQAASRVPALVPVRNGRMSASPFAFYRGSAAVMAADLSNTPRSGIQVQLCGDAHLSNFGGYAARDRSLVFDLNDFDETLPGPWEWDVKRLVASLEIAGRERGFEDSERRSVVRSAAAAYRQAMRQFAELSTLQVWYLRMTVADIRDRWGATAGKRALRDFDTRIRKAMVKDSAHAFSKLTTMVDGKPQILSDPPLMVPIIELLDRADHTTLEALIQQTLAGYRDSLSEEHRHLLEQFRYVDAARKVVGVGSVGTRSWVVLMAGTDGEPLVLQMKEALPSALAPYVGSSRYGNQGQRVVVGQKLLQGSPDIFLGFHRAEALDGAKRDFHVRQLSDGKISANVGKHSHAAMTIYAQMCGWTLARGHARSGDRIALAGYLGGGDVFDVAMGDFAQAYADQNERDYARFLDAVREHRVEVSLAL